MSVKTYSIIQTNSKQFFIITIFNNLITVFPLINAPGVYQILKLLGAVLIIGRR